MNVYIVRYPESVVEEIGAFRIRKPVTQSVSTYESQDLNPGCLTW